MPINNLGITPGLVKARVADFEAKLGNKVGGTPKSGQLDNPLGGAPKSSASGAPPRLASLNTLKAGADIAAKFAGFPSSSPVPPAPPQTSLAQGHAALAADQQQGLAQTQHTLDSNHQMSMAVEQMKAKAEMQKALLKVVSDSNEATAKDIAKAASGLKNL